MAVKLLPMFQSGQGADQGVAMDDAEFKEKRRIAAALMQDAMKQRRIEHPTQGWAQMAHAALAGYDQYKLESDRKREQADFAKTLRDFYQGSVGGGTSSAQPSPSAPPPPPPPPQAGGIPNTAFNDASLFSGFADGGGDMPPPPPPPQMAEQAPPPPPPPPPANMPFAPSPAGAALSMRPPEMPSSPGPSYAGGNDPPPQFAPRFGPRTGGIGAPNMPPPADGDRPPDFLPRMSPQMRPQSGPTLMREGGGMQGPETQWQGQEAPQQFERMNGGPLAIPRPMPPQAPPAPPGPPPSPMPPGIMDAAKQTAGMFPEAVPPSRSEPFQFTQDFSAGRGGRPLDRKALDTVVAHDTSGVNGRLSDPQNINAYHFMFDDKGTYKLRPDNVQAPHATSFNPRSLALAYRGMEGSQVPPEAIENGAKIARYMMDTYGMTPEQFKSHPSLGASGTRGGGKDPREAAWLPAVLERAQAMKGGSPTGMMALGSAPEGAPPPDPRFAGAHASNADRAAAINSGGMNNSAPIRLAQAGGQLSPDLIDRLSRDPRGQAILGRIIEERRQRDLQASDPMEQAKLRHLEAQTKAIEAGGKAPPGYRSTREGNLEAIPGGPADIKINEKRQQDFASATQMVQQLDELEKSVNSVMKAPGLGSNFGLYGMVPNRPGSEAANAHAALETLKTQGAFAVLQAMRNASKTGGALGAVSDRETGMLERALAPLQQSQSVEQAQKSLQSILDHIAASKERIRGAYNDHWNNGGMSARSPMAPRPDTGAPGITQGLPPGWSIRKLD